MSRMMKKKLHQLVAGVVRDDGTVTVRLVAPHEHAGVELQPGAIIDLQPDQAEWLIGLERAVPYKRNSTTD